MIGNLKMYLFFDTETTGFARPSLPPRDMKQGRVCQLAMVLTDKNGIVRAEYASLIAPDHWTIQTGAQKVHGHTDVICGEYGVKSRMAFQLFQRFAAKADTLVAHNIDFDHKIMVNEAAAHKMDMPVFEHKICTMKDATETCRIPKKKGSGYKWPSLEEALDVLCGEKLEGAAHDAMVDTRGCVKVFFELKKRGVFPERSNNAA